MRTFLFVVILVFLLFGIAFIAMLIYSPKKTVLSDAQKQTALKKILGRDPIVTEKIRSAGAIVYDGKYIKFFYPAAAENYPNNQNVKNSTFVLEDKEFKESSPLYHFTFQVLQYGNGVISYNDVPSIHLRRTQTEIYKESPIAIGNEQGIAFVNQSDGYEKDAFLLQGGLLYTFVITGGNPDIESIFDGVVKSVVVKQM